MAAFLGQIPADVITAYVAIAVAAGTAFWTVTRFVADRRAARAEATALAEQELRQRRHEEARSREHHAAELIRAVGQATDPVARRWTMSALSLYPDQTLDLLLTSLGDAGPEDTATIKLAVLSVGPRALPKTVRAHRIAGQLCATSAAAAASAAAPAGADTERRATRQLDLDSAARVRDRTCEIVVNTLLQLDDDERASVDLADVDLTGVNLAHTRLRRIRFRKTHLDRADLTRAFLRDAVLRGATMDGTVLTHASLQSADLTGVSGALHAVRADLSDSTLDGADLSGSALDAANLNRVSLRKAELTEASLAGATMHGASVDGARMRRVVAHHLTAAKLRVVGSDLSHSDLCRARVAESWFERVRLVRIDGTGMVGEDSNFVDCNLGGARATQSNFSQARFRKCNLGGVVLADAVLQEVRFESCAFSSTDLSGASLAGAQVRACSFRGTVDLTGVDLAGVVVEDCTFAGDATFTLDNESWRKAQLDEPARTAFERMSHETPRLG